MDKLTEVPRTAGVGVSPEPGVASVERRAFGLPGVPAVLLWLGLAGVAGGLFRAWLTTAAVILSALAWQRPATVLPGARAMAAQMLTLAVGATLPLLSTHPAVLLLSGLLFGGSFLAVVTFTTILTRRTLPEPAWGRGIAAFTVIFAAGQTLGPLLTGALSDGAGGLRLGLGVSALVLLAGAGLAWGQPMKSET